MASGAVTLLYVAPERLDDPRFLEVAGSRGVALLAVDEAHCISQWGNDFRPSYQRILGFIDGLPARPAVMALTATATRAVREDIAGSLGLADPFTVVASFDRPNLSFAVEHAQGRAQKDRALLSFVRQRPERSAIGPTAQAAGPSRRPATCCVTPGFPPRATTPALPQRSVSATRTTSSMTARASWSQPTRLAWA